MTYILGVNLLPSTGEFTYDTVAYLGQRVTETSLTSINRYANGGPLAGTGSTTDYTIALDNLQAEFPGCTTVALVVSWFGNSTDITACQLYPSTTYIGGAFQQASGAADRVALFRPDAEFVGSDRHSAGRRRVHLWRHAVGSIDRALHSRSQVARAAGRVLSLHPDDGERRAVARPHHLQRHRHFERRDDRGR